LLSVIIPVFNEEKQIKSTLNDVIAYRNRKIFDIDIHVINDGSTDRTQEILQNLKIHHDFTLINNSKNRGKGFAVRQGMLHADGSHRLFMDADNATPIDEFDKMVPSFERGSNIVIGSRKSQSRNVISRPFRRRFSSFIFHEITRLTLPIEVNDTQAGFKAFTASAANRIFSRQCTNGWTFDVEILLLAKMLDYEIKSVPVAWDNNDLTNLNARNLAKSFIEYLELLRRYYFVLN